jgi:hypothetical protein
MLLVFPDLLPDHGKKIAAWKLEIILIRLCHTPFLSMPSRIVNVPTADAFQFPVHMQSKIIQKKTKNTTDCSEDSFVFLRIDINTYSGNVKYLLCASALSAPSLVASHTPFFTHSSLYLYLQILNRYA